MRPKVLCSLPRPLPQGQKGPQKSKEQAPQKTHLLPWKVQWTHLEKQRGGIGLRGPGETEIETDRRVIRDKLARLKEKLREIDRQNITQRKQRGQMVRV